MLRDLEGSQRKEIIQRIMEPKSLPYHAKERNVCSHQEGANGWRMLALALQGSDAYPDPTRATNSETPANVGLLKSGKGLPKLPPPLCDGRR